MSSDKRGVLQVSKDKIVLTPEMYTLLLSSKEYVSYIVHNQDGEVFLNFKNIPKDVYMPINNDYIMALAFINIVNKCELADLIQIVKKDSNNV